MKWYTDYLSAYEKPYSELPPPLTNRVKKRIRELQHPNPLVSVVVIAHNEENRIFSCLWSICENNCHFPIEIIVINNHSTDNTESILKKLGVTYYNEEQKGPGFARQCGLNHAKGKYCVCIDSDTMYPPLYITTMTKALQQKGWQRMPFGVSFPTNIIHKQDFFSMKNCVMFISTYSIYEDLNSMYEEWSLLFKQTQHTK